MFRFRPSALLLPLATLPLLAAGSPASLDPAPSRAPSVAPDWPEIQASGWVNLLGEPPNVDRLQGQTVVLVFITTDPDSQGGANWRVLRKLHYDHHDKGVVFLGVSTASTAAMETYLENNLVPFPVACGSNSASAFGASSTAFSQILIDKNGEEEWRGPTNGIWNGLLLKTARGSDRVGPEGALRLHIEGELPRPVERQAERLSEGELGKALGDLDEMLADPELDEDVRRDAQLVRDAAADHVARLEGQIRRMLERGEVLPAIEVLEVFARDLRRHELGASVTALLEYAEEDEQIQEEVEAAEDYEHLVNQYWSRGPSKAAARLERLIEEHRGTLAARKARLLLDDR